MFKNLNEILNNPNAKRQKGQKTSYRDYSDDILDFVQLVQNWDKIVGTSLAQNSQPLKIQNSTLFVLVKHSVFSQELNFLSETLKQKIIEHFPSLRSFVYQIKYLSSPQFFQKKAEQKLEQQIKHSQTNHPQSPYYLQKKAEAEKIFSHLEDREAKDLLVSLYLQTHETD
ncbi:MAG: DUF721 domain-containing protein [Bacteriovoracaceae bacterium]|nr:DUF721 domain-containing protein [Bacteriovoracaceae bacterium]